MKDAAVASVKFTDTGIPIRNVWHMLMYAWNEYQDSRLWGYAAEEDAPSLDALLAGVLLRIYEQRLRIGPGGDYMPREQLLRGVRGRIHFSKSIKTRAFEQGQAFCEFEHFTANAPKNQIIRSTLATIAAAGDFGPDSRQAEPLRHRIRRLVHWLEGIDLIEVSPAVVRRELLKRHDHDYRMMLELCYLILLRRQPAEYGGERFTRGLDRDRLILHRVFESFVANFYAQHLSGWKVSPQKHFDWYARNENKHLPVMKPDILLEERAGGRIIIIDTKFTAKSLKMNQWGGAMFASSHLYQMYTYLNTQAHRSEPYRNATGILLYPAVSRDLAETIELGTHRLRIATVDLTAEWQNIEVELQALIEE